MTGEYESVPKVQRAYKAAKIGSIVVGDENYGEGSSREHAAMEPRFLGVRAVLVRRGTVSGAEGAGFISPAWR
jgi:aconitate hydratase